MPLFNEFPPANKALWKEQALKDLKGKDFDQTLLWHTQEGFTVQPYYTQEDLVNLPLESIQSSQTTEGWENRQEIIFLNEKITNSQVIKALQSGADAICIDLSKVNVLDINLSKLLDKVKLSDTPVYFKVNNQSQELLAGLGKFINYQMKGGLYDDALARWMTTGFWDDTSFINLKKSIAQTYNSPRFRTITVQSHHFHNAGANVVQELAFTLASVVEYFDNLMDESPDSFKIQELTENLSVSLSVGTDYFMEIAKIRAWKYLYNQVIVAYQVEEPTYDSSPFLHCQTSAYYQSVLTPSTNMLRASTEAMSAIMGGCDALTVRAYNADIDVDTDEFSQRIARNVSSILKEESYLDKASDPTAGSYYLENLTNELAINAWALFQEIEGMGGIIEAFKKGYIQTKIKEANLYKQSQLQANKTVMVGVNKFRFDEEPFQKPIKANVEKATTDFELLVEQRLSEGFEG